MGNLFVGTSGFAYKEWKGPFYPEKHPDKQMLAIYSSKLPSVEINYTFRRLPSESTLTTWKEQAADNFLFTLKASQRITHFKRLRETKEDVDTFVRLARILEPHLGVILFQTPPNLAFEANALKTFVSELPMPFKYAMEFRHESFASEEAVSILRDNGVAICGAETDEKALAEVPVTADHIYLRLRKEIYESDELKSWASRLQDVLSDGHDVFCYFKHEGGGSGPAFALSVQEMVG